MVDCRAVDRVRSRAQSIRTMIRKHVRLLKRDVGRPDIQLDCRREPVYGGY